MGTIADKLLYLDATKTALREAINRAGGSIAENTPFRQYANWVRKQGASLDLDFIREEYIARNQADNKLDRFGFSNIITFTRASGGGRFNASGVYEFVGNDVARLDYDPVTLQPLGLLIEEQRTNLLLRSSEFDNGSWIKGADASITPNSQTAPDGTTTADMYTVLTGTGNSNLLQGVSTTAGATYTASLRFKAATGTWFRFFVYDASLNGFRVWFNAATGLIGSSSSSGSGTLLGASIVQLKDGWMAVSLAGSSPGAALTVQMNCVGADGSSLNAVGSIYIWGAQLEVGAFPTSYIPTVASQVTRAADVITLNTGAV